MLWYLHHEAASPGASPVVIARLLFDGRVKHPQTAFFVYHITHDGSMYGIYIVYMVTWIPSILTPFMLAYIPYMDPSWVTGNHTEHVVDAMD